MYVGVRERGIGDRGGWAERGIERRNLKFEEGGEGWKSSKDGMVGECEEREAEIESKKKI